MSPGAIEVKADGTLWLMPSRAPNPQGLADALSLFAERLPPRDAAPHYRLSAASVWRGRRLGLPLERMIETLERHSGQTLPPKLREDLTRWSGQIDRLQLEVEGDRLILSSPNPLVITAVMRHRTLGAFVEHPIDATTGVLKTEAYPELVAAFDACDVPILDRVPPARPPHTCARASGPRHPLSSHQPPIDSVLPPDFIEMVRPHLPHACQATTRAGRPCKNRARPHAAFCRVHAHWAPDLSGSWPKGGTPLRSSRVALTQSRCDFSRSSRPQSGQCPGSRGPGFLAPVHPFRCACRGVAHGALVGWVDPGVAWLLTCWLLGRLVLPLPLRVSLHVVFDLLGTVVKGFGHPEGLKANLFFFVIPVVIPVAIVWYMDLGMGGLFAVLSGIGDRPKV